VRLTPAIGAAVTKAPEERRAGNVESAVHGDKKILAQNLGAMKAKILRGTWNGQPIAGTEGLSADMQLPSPFFLNARGKTKSLTGLSYT